MGETVLGSPYGFLRWRNIGPHRGGRVSAVAGHPSERLTFYFGSCGGGVWKTEDGGIIWENISDGFFNTASMGALAVAESNPNVVLAGTGEANIRGNVSHGDGIYGSTDGGKSWRHLGLTDSRHIAKIRIHPRDENLFYVAVLGHAYGPSRERGIYRTSDGGKTFDLVLSVDEDTGAIDLSMDPRNPRVLYAAMWQVRRTPHSLTSGGPGSGLYRTNDGGDTWEKISGKHGFPPGVLGRIGVSASGAREGRVYALVEAEDGGMVRSDDGGTSWEVVSSSKFIRVRSWYYTHVIADPVNEDTVYALFNRAWKSIDGGRSYTPFATPHGDNHDLWIDPHDPRRMIEGNDGGACVSFDGGSTWSSIYNQSTAELYHVTTSNTFPYRVYGAQQDNTTISIPSRSDYAGITEREWYSVGGAESGYIAVRPDQPDVVFAGSSGGGEGGRLTRYDARTRQQRDVSVWPERTRGLAAEEYTYRFQWTSPLLLSPHDPGTLYSAGNCVFRSRNEGSSWERISPDLTRNDRERLGPTGGPITKEHVGVEVYCTVFALAESPVQPGLLWAGSDDGLIHRSPNGGETWDNVTPKSLPDWSLVSMIEPSHFDAATAYLAANRYKLDDRGVYLYKTSDNGATWNEITTGIHDGDYVRAIREHPVCKGLLFCGTEGGVYVSFDDGGTWESLRCNLPVVPVHDLEIRDDDLVAATHGRGFWILDDLTPLRQLKERPTAGGHRLFRPRDTLRIHSDVRLRVTEGQSFDKPVVVAPGAAGRPLYLKAKPGPGEAPAFTDAGENPPPGVLVHYLLGQEHEEPVTLTFKDARDVTIRTFSSEEPGEEHPDEPRLPARAGANRFVWDMRYPTAVKARNMVGDFPCAPLVAPGTYKVVLEAGTERAEAEFGIKIDPRVEVGDDELQEQTAFLLRVRDAVSRVHEAVNGIRLARDDTRAVMERGRGNDQIQKAGEALLGSLDALEQGLIQTAMKDVEDEIAYPPGLNAQLAHQFNVASSADAPPTQQTYELFDQLTAKMEERMGAMRDIGAEIAQFSQLGQELNVPSVRIPAG